MGVRYNLWHSMDRFRTLSAVALMAVAGAWFALSVPLVREMGDPGGGALAAEPAKPLVDDIRAADHGGRTRVVLSLDRSVDFTVFPLADPYRVVIDLPEVGWRLPSQPLPAGIGLMERLRYGLFQPGTTRVVLDMKGPVAIANAFWLEADAQGRHRLVVDIGAASRDAMIAGLRDGVVKVAAGGGAKAAPVPEATRRLSALTPPPALTPPVANGDSAARPKSPPPTSAAQPPVVEPVAAPADSGEEDASDRIAALAVPATEPEAAPFGAPPRKPPARRLGGKRVIVIDPGHGGLDPGTVGANGTHEKHVTLAMAKELKRQLEQTGRYKVVLTRDRDIFLRLRDRVAIAREAGADLFMSIHADSIADGAARGPSVYTLSEKASDREAAELAEKENKADVIAGIDLSHETPEVGSILIDLAQRETMNRSAHFAAGMIGEIRKETAVLRNTHRFAGFAVLKAPDVPSVLVELGFLSNPSDEKALLNRAYRAKLAQAIVRATDRFFTRVEEAKR
ncbi:MAG: AMIN domain-containing protein [Rhodospirillales bacterium]|nr:AMIN domain-containing protein [Rhodospirillales bacterium]